MSLKTRLTLIFLKVQGIIVLDVVEGIFIIACLGWLFPIHCVFLRLLIMGNIKDAHLLRTHPILFHFISSISRSCVP